MSSYDLEVHIDEVEKRREFFVSMLQQYKTYDDYLMFAKLIVQIVLYFQGNPDEELFMIDYGYDANRTTIDEYKFRSTGNFNTNVEAFSWYPEKDDFTSIDTKHGLISFGRTTGVGFQEFVLEPKVMEDLVEYDKGEIPMIRTAEEYFQYSLVYEDYQMFTLVVNTYLIDSMVPPFFLDADLLPEIFRAMGDYVNDYVPGNEFVLI